MLSGRFSSATLERIRSRIDLVRLMQESGVALTRAGKNYKGRCPFHQDDTPSLSVSPEKGLYHCFGCGASGTVFTFVAQREGISFEEAVRKLADRAGVPLEDRAATVSPEGQQIAGANRFAREHFHECLMNPKTGASAMAYLLERGIREETIRELRLGYAPDAWDHLFTAMTRAGYEPDLLVKAGLLRQNEQGRRYDYFRNRIIFPIENLNGEVVAFGGRALDDATPKYLNSPETLLYHKSDILYFLNRARNAIREERSVLIAEGYLDAIALYQEGIHNVVATLGTALTESHAHLLRRFTQQVRFVFDGDEAGRRAIARGAPHFLEQEFETHVVLLPEGMDPDDYVRQYGAEAFRDRVAEAVPLVEFQLRLLARDSDVTDVETKIAHIAEIAELLRHVRSPILLRDYVNRLATALDLDIEDVWAELRKHRVYVRRSRSTETAMPSSRRSEGDAIERQLLGSLLIAPEHILSVFEELSPSDFQDPRHRELARILWMAERETGEVDPHQLMEACYDEEVRELIAELLMEDRALPGIALQIEACVLKMIERAQQQFEREHLAETSEGGEVDETALARELMEQSKQRRLLRERLAALNSQNPEGKEGHERSVPR